MVDESQNNMAYTGEPDRETCDGNSTWRFTVNWQVITDTKTGLVRSKETKNTWVNWEQAKDYCANLTTWWKTNWRLPDVPETRSIVNWKCHRPATYEEFNFVEVKLYWLSNTYESNTGYAWVLNFFYGGVGWRDKTENHYVLCVSDPE